jgi:hypothetical protein
MVLNVNKNQIDAKIAQNINSAASGSTNGGSLSSAFRNSLPNLKAYLEDPPPTGTDTSSENHSPRSDMSRTPRSPDEPLFFGKPLETAPLTDSPKPIPTLCADVINILKPHIEMEGIFRVSGDLANMNNLKKKYDDGNVNEEVVKEMLRKNVRFHL